MTLMLTLGTAVFGAQKTLPSGKDTGSINVTNLKPGDTVTAYQFVKADYNEYGFTGYSAIPALLIVGFGCIGIGIQLLKKENKSE